MNVAMTMRQIWKALPCKKSELHLDATLGGGQCFRWKKSEDGIWTGVFNNRVWILSQTEDTLLYKCYQSHNEQQDCNKSSGDCKKSKRRKITPTDEDNDTMLNNYFRLDIDLVKFYKQWSEADPYFKELASTLYGIRILDQDVVENLFSFICSSNNNITRISSMVEKLCALYGTEIAVLDDIHHYSFPDVERLCSPEVESELRKAGFGYRAKFIHQSACKIKSLGCEKWIQNLKQMPYAEAKRELMTLPGIGPKVADCICLMSLGHLQAIPVDTHIFQMASKYYLPHLKGCKSVTEKVYNEIGSHFQNLYGEMAGWAHTIIFCSDLKFFKKEVKEKKG